jgi:hypothetical protein
MDYQKLKLDKYRSIRILNMPRGMKIGFASKTTKNDCILAFAQKRGQVLQAISAVNKLQKPAALIIIYPKKTSPKYKSEINRDSIFQDIKDHCDLHAPKIMSMDEDWTAFSFRIE